MKKLLLIPLLFLAGCRVLSYKTQEGAQVDYWTIGLNTTLEGLEVQTTKDGKIIKIAKGSSDSTRALDTVDAALAKVPSPVSTSKTTIIQPKTTAKRNP